MAGRPIKSYGISPIINSLAIDSIENPHLNNDFGTTFATPDKIFGSSGLTGL
jgi:hypothetical protein